MKIQTFAALFIAALSFTTFASAKPTTTQKLPTLASQLKKPLSFDTIPARGGVIKITPILHASIQIEYRGTVVLVDPISAGSYRKVPDLVLITHSHSDHFDPAALFRFYNRSSMFIPNSTEFLNAMQNSRINLFPSPTTLGYFQEVSFGDILKVQAVPAYNLVRGPKPDQKFHPKGDGNGYILTLGGKRIYIAGDTEATPEMKALKNIDAAFLPMNLPYTMTPQEAANAVRAFKPKVVYPYHFRYPFDKPNTNVQQFAAALRGSKTEVRVLDWYNAAPVTRFMTRQNTRK